MTTIQFDFTLPERFNMTFVDSDGKEKRPYMVHRALLGSLERFFGVLTEHYGGAFPVWIAPVQVSVIPVSAAFNDYGKKVAETLRQAGFRAELDGSDQRMNAKIRGAQTRKIPYMLIAGEKEMQAESVSLRLRTGDQGGVMTVADFVRFISDKVEKKELI
jgi:threonyl-tRNA synthetase